jgi:ferric-dicitrate binding protein FerR (iron transport regulator)
MKADDPHKQAGTDSRKSDKLAELFRHVDAREKPPEAEMQAIRDAVYEEWKAHTRKRRQLRWGGGLAIAASMLLVITISLIQGGPGSSAPAKLLADSGRQLGTVHIRSADGSEIQLSDQQVSLKSGQSIITGYQSGLSLHWEGGAVIRLGENSELTLQSHERLELDHGKVFIDTSPAGHSLPAPAIATPQGHIDHIGTAYMTEAGPFGTRVSVREGRIRFAHISGDAVEPSLTSTGTQLLVKENGEQTEVEINTWGEQWAWAEQLADDYPAEDRNMEQFFQWIGRETGREVVYLTPEVQELAGKTLLHGTVTLPPMQALEVATSTSDFAAELRDGQILISMKP